MLRSPLTNEPLETAQLIPNQNLRVLIQSYHRRNMDQAAGGGGFGGPHGHGHHGHGGGNGRGGMQHGGYDGDRDPRGQRQYYGGGGMSPGGRGRGYGQGPQGGYDGSHGHGQHSYDHPIAPRLDSHRAGTGHGHGPRHGRGGLDDLDGLSDGLHGTGFAHAPAASAGWEGSATASAAYRDDDPSPAPTVITEGGLFGTLGVTVNPNSPLMQNLTQLIGAGGIAKLVSLSAVEEKDMVRKKVRTRPIWSRCLDARLTPTQSLPSAPRSRRCCARCTA